MLFEQTVAIMFLVNAITTGWRRFRDPYRPELHYMRGPGPRWHTKHRSHVASDML